METVLLSRGSLTSCRTLAAPESKSFITYNSDNVSQCDFPNRDIAHGHPDINYYREAAFFSLKD